MRIFLGIVAIAWGLYVLIRQKKFAAAGARFHRRLGSRAPWLYWFPPVRRAAGSATLWRIISPLGGVVMITVGIFFLTYRPG